MPTQDNTNTTRIQFLRVRKAAIFADATGKTPSSSNQNDLILGSICLVTKGELSGKNTAPGCPPA